MNREVKNKIKNLVNDGQVVKVFDMTIWREDYRDVILYQVNGNKRAFECQNWSKLWLFVDSHVYNSVRKS